MKKIISIFISIAIFSAFLPVYTASAASSFTTSNGSVIIEAEGANWTEAKLTNAYKGFEKKSDSNASGGYYLRPHSYAGTSDDPSSLLSFTITANEAGRYSLWVRASSSATDGSAFHIKYTGVDWYRDELSPADSGNYTWVKLVGGYPMAKNATVTFNFAPKNVDNHIDCFIFTDKATFVPSGVVSSVSSPTLSTSTYGAPTITPISKHPRVMFNSTTLETIRSNYSKSQNEKARTSFEGYRDVATNGTRTFTSAVTTNSSWEIEYQIEADAFEYALNGTVENGNSAITELINYLSTVTYDPYDDDISRDMGATIFHAAEVYDWCYPLLTTEQKNTIINHCEGIASGLEQGYPPSGGHNVSGHAGEPNIFRDLLAFGIAVYNERPDIYNYVMGRIQNYMVPPRNDFYRSHSPYQGISYGYYRYNFELYAYYLTLQATGQELFSDDFKQVIYSYIYSRRPDGRLFSYGDDASVTWAGYNGYSFRAVKMAADIFNDRQFKQEYYLMRGNEAFGSIYCKDYQSFNAVRSLIMNKPDTPFQYDSKDHSALPKSRYFGSPNGMILARTNWDYGKADDNKLVDMTDQDTVAAMMKIGEKYGANHDHLDAGSFQLYYKGILASDSGAYDGDDYDAEHNTNYAKRTVAHNCLTIYDSTEPFSVLGTGTANDGGQLFYNEATNFANWNYNRGTVLRHAIADNNSYSYIKGDITAAYKSTKAKKVLRSMAFIPTADEHFKAMMIVYDEVKSANNSQIKKFLLHTQAEPTISGNTVTVENTTEIMYGANGKDGKIQNGGRLTMKTLLPASASISKIGGDGHEFDTNGTNYEPQDADEIYDLHEAGWGRVEVKAASEGTETDFLNVLAVSDAGDTTALPANLINSTNYVGVEALNKVVIFAKGNSKIGEKIIYTPSGSGDVDVTVFDVEDGGWIAVQQGYGAYPMNASEGTISFTVKAGTAFSVEQGSLFDVTDPILNEIEEDANMAALPEEAVDTINGGNFTLIFTPTVITRTANSKKSVSLIGNANDTFAVYMLRDVDDIYVKMPGTYSILTRAALSKSEVLGNRNTITFSKDTKMLNWYVDGELKTSVRYPKGQFDLKSIPFIGGGGTVEFSEIRLYNLTLTADEVLSDLDNY